MSTGTVKEPASEQMTLAQVGASNDVPVSEAKLAKGPGRRKYKRGKGKRGKYNLKRLDSISAKLAARDRAAGDAAKVPGIGAISKAMVEQVGQMVISLHGSMRMMVGVSSASVILTIDREGHVTAASPKFQE